MAPNQSLHPTSGIAGRMEYHGKEARKFSRQMDGGSKCVRQ